ncbi:hypothetical protein BFG58_19075 [Enterobacter sp. ku-bf2]|nr:hypothetical protein BFG58_19075 [Enterobacter sp. ku-bf2]
MLSLTVILQFFAKNIVVENSSEMYLDINLYDLVTELLYKMESLKEGQGSPMFKGFLLCLFLFVPGIGMQDIAILIKVSDFLVG